MEKKVRISYLIPEPSSKGGMAAITQMLYQINHFDNVDTFHFCTSFKSEKRYIRMFEFFYMQLSFIVHLIKVRPQVIFVMSNSYFGFYDKCVYCLSARLFGVKSMLNHVGGEFDKFYHTSGLTERLVRFFIQFPTVLVIGSEFWCNYFRTSFPSKKVYNSPNPIISADYDSVLDRGDKKLVVSSVFRLVKEKGVYELIEVIKKVTAQSDSVEFVIMGGGPMLGHLKTELEPLVKAQKVRILGFVDEPQKIEEIIRSDVYMMLTYFDLMPISIMEAMAASKPILTTKVGGIPDLVKDGENGYLFEVGEVDRVVEKIFELKSKPNSRREMGAKGKKIIHSTFDINIIVDLHQQIAQQLVDENTRQSL